MDKKWYQKVSTWFTILLVIIIIPIIIFNIVIIYKSYKYPDKIPDFFGYKPFIVVSQSMEPEINKGDLVIVKISDTKSLDVGEVISFRNKDNKVVTHEIVEVITDDEIKYKTKGIANPSADENFVTQDKIEGKYAFKISGFGNTLMFFTETTNVIIIILILIIIFMASYFIIFNKQKKLEERNIKRGV